MPDTTPKLNGHVHAIAHHPKTSNGWAVCVCGATQRVENGAPSGGWHTCATCTPDFYPETRQ